MSFEVNKTTGGNYILYKISGANSLQNFIDSQMNYMRTASITILKTLYWMAAINTLPEWGNNQFSENVIQNRGGQLQHFKSLKDTERWLSKI